MSPVHLRAPALYKQSLSPPSGLLVSYSTVEGSRYRGLMMNSLDRFLFHNEELLIIR